MTEAKYKILRMYHDPSKTTRVIKRGLTLEEAKAHCYDPETSSNTATSSAAKKHTQESGKWFDGYREDK